MTDYSPQESATASTPAQSGTESAPPSNEPNWFLDDVTPGIGERPAWLPAKYNKVSDLAKGYTEAEKRLGSFIGAPEEYNLGDLEVDEDQFILQEMKAAAKEINMNEDGLKKFVGRFYTALETMAEANLGDQVKKLGPDGERELKQYESFSKTARPEQAEVFKEWIKTSDDLKVFNELIAGTTPISSVPTSQSMALANSHETVAELRKELSDPNNLKRYENDKHYAQNYSKRLSQAVARENR